MSQEGPEESVLNPQEGESRRQHPRFDINKQVVITTQFGQSFKGETHNISLGGLLVFSENLVTAIGDKVFIEVMTEGVLNSEHFVGQIVHLRVGRSGMNPGRFVGVKFLKQNPLRKAAVSRFIGNI